MLLALIAFAHAACPAPTTALDLERRLTKAEQGFAEIDPVGLRAALEQARETLPCMGEAVTPGVAARLHRAEGLAALDANNRALAEQAFAAARAVEPDFALPSAYATETVRDIYMAVDPARGATQPLGKPKAGSVRLDGVEARARPLERPTVFQRLGPTGEVIETAYLLPGMPVPAYEVQDVQARKGARVGLIVGGAGGIAAAGALYAGAAAIRSGPYTDAVEGWELRGSSADRDQAESLYATNHALVIGSAALAGLGMVAGTLGVAVRW